MVNNRSVSNVTENNEIITVAKDENMLLHETMMINGINGKTQEEVAKDAAEDVELARAYDHIDFLHLKSCMKSPRIFAARVLLDLFGLVIIISSMTSLAMVRPMFHPFAAFLPYMLMTAYYTYVVLLFEVFYFVQSVPNGCVYDVLIFCEMHCLVVGMVWDRLDGDDHQLFLLPGFIVFHFVMLLPFTAYLPEYYNEHGSTRYLSAGSHVLFVLLLASVWYATYWAIRFEIQYRESCQDIS